MQDMIKLVLNQTVKAFSEVLHKGYGDDGKLLGQEIVF